MTSAHEADLDVLFRLRPAEMVEARNALADRLKKAGDREGAQRVKALKRPAPAAWALNQVHFHEPELLDQAQAQAARMRAMHARDSVDPRELWALANAQRSATGAVVDAALEHCRSGGLPHGQPQQRKILVTVQAWLAGVGEEPPGRMTLELEAGGFDAVSEVGHGVLRAPVERPGLPSAAPLAQPLPQAIERDRHLLEETQAALREAEQHFAQTQHDVAQCHDAQQRAQAALAQTKLDVQEAERALSSLRFLLKQSNDELVRTTEAREKALKVSRAAEANVERLRERLARISGSNA